jgi:hypothetical protein
VGTKEHARRLTLLQEELTRFWSLLGSAFEHGNLKRPAILAALAFITRRESAAAVAVGMWEPAFGAGFQAPREG